MKSTFTVNINKMKKKRSKIFDKDYSPYGTYEGKRGNPNQWRDAFKERFTAAERKAILKEDSAWTILGLEPGASLTEIKRAFRLRARETHPDHNPHLADGEAFKKVNAAYQELTGD